MRGDLLTDILQMARKMDFSVVGLPHYTIWHLYEPSVDDVKHMEVRLTDSNPGQSTLVNLNTQEMEQEKLAREKEEKEQAEKEKKLKEGYSFGESSQQWEKDKDAVSNMVKTQREEAQSGSDAGGKPQQSGKPEANTKHDEEDLRKKGP